GCVNAATVPMAITDRRIRPHVLNGESGLQMPGSMTTLTRPATRARLTLTFPDLMPQSTSQNRPVLLVFLLSLVSLTGYALRTNIPAAQEYMMPELGLTPPDMGTISALGFQLAYALFQTPVGFLGDRFGTRRVLAVAILGWGVTTLATGLVPAS